MGFDIGSIAGGLAGGLLGGMDANSGPAGTTKKTTSEDLPPWIKDLYTGNLSGATALRDRLTGSVNPLFDLSQDEIGKTIRGDYLDPASNPWLAATGENVAGQIGRTVDSRFEGAGRYGSGAHQDLLGTTVGRALTELYGTNYANERGRQATTAMNLPTYMANEYGAEFAPYLNFAKLIPNLKTSETEEPYFRNKGAGILGGALAGSSLAGMFGGGGFDLASLLGGGGAAAGGAGAAGMTGAADLLPLMAVMA